MSGGTELPVLWAGVVLAVLAESALQFASRAKIEDELDGKESRERYARYLDSARSIEAFCALVRIAASAAFVTIAILRARPIGSAWVAGACAGVLLVVAELLGRALGRKWSSGVLLRLLPALYWLSCPLRPSWAPGRRSNGPKGAEPEPEVVDAAREEIRVAIQDGAAEGALDEEEKEMIEGILKFGGVDVAEIMTPRTELECLEADTPVPQAVRSLSESPHSRIPVYEGDLDQIVGVVHVKDLLAATVKGNDSGGTLRDIMREPYFVPETKTVGTLLQECQREHVQIAIVLDEYGGVSGLVTVEDIMEEIVGEIEDEYDEEDHENRVRVRSSGGIEVDGRVRIDELNEDYDLDLPEDEDYDTVGGLVAALFGRLPTPGEQMRHNGLLLRVLQSDERRVQRVFLKRLERNAPP